MRRPASPYWLILTLGLNPYLAQGQETSAKAGPDVPASAPESSITTPAAAPAAEATPPAPAAAAAEPTEPALPTEPNMVADASSLQEGQELTPPPPMTELFPQEGQEEDALPADFNQTVTMKLLEALVAQGTLKKDKAEELMAQARNEAIALVNREKARKAAETAVEDDAMRVSYVPVAVRKQLKEEIRNEVMEELKPGGKISLLHEPATGPLDDFFGDLRLRYESITLPEGNDNTGSFPNFNAINTGTPFDTAGTVFSPQYNADQDRQRFRTRLRMGADLQLDDNWLVGIRLASGNDNSPTTTNQTIGGAGSGQGGGFSKQALWIDRAFARWQKEGKRGSVQVNIGRFDSPFQSTSIIFDEDLGFDGAAIRLKANMHDSFKPWVSAGAFPIFNTDLNFATNQPAKFRSIDKYLYGAQVGVDWKLAQKVKAKISGAYYNFANAEGLPSTPYLPLSASDGGDTDHTRPSFAQRGNTYRPLRTIIPDPLNNFGTASQFQYFGLASQFKPVTANARVDFDVLEPIQISFIGEYVKNTAFDRQAIDPIAVNNRGPLPVDPATGTASGLGVFDGDDTAWIFGIKFGNPALQKAGDWQGGVDYRWVGSDAVIDGFVDSEFGGGGTNVKGLNVGAKVAISKKASIGVAWMSAEQIAGPPLRSDYFQLDFNIKF